MTGNERALSVRAKILLVVVVSIVVLTALVYMIAKVVLSDSYRTIERSAVEQDLRRVADAITEFEHQQTVKLQDWAQWDDSYTFAKERNADFLESAMLATGLQNLDINSMAYLDLSGEVIAMMVIDLETAEELSVDVIRGAITSNREISVHESLESRTEGILLLPDGPLIVSSLPLRTTDGGGPSTGSIVFARYLDETKIEEIGALTHLSLSSYRFDSKDLPEDVQAAKVFLSTASYHVVPVDEDTVRGYTLIRDLKGDPALILRIDNPRPVYAQGNLTSDLFMAGLVVAFIIFGIVVLVMIDRLVVARFLRLTRDVAKVNDTKDLSIQVQGGEQDEIGKLAGHINHLLGWLLEARKGEASSRREILNRLDEQKQEKDQMEEMARIEKGRQ